MNDCHLTRKFKLANAVQIKTLVRDWKRLKARYGLDERRTVMRLRKTFFSVSAPQGYQKGIPESHLNKLITNFCRSMHED